MGLVGLIDPSHAERAEDEPGRYPNWFAPDELLQLSARMGPKWSPWPYELIASVLAHEGDRGDRLSVTALTGGCARDQVIRRREDYIESLDSFYAAIRGTQIHAALEGQTRPDGVAEARFFADIGGVELSGSPDLVTPTAIYDWKTTDNPPTYYPWKSHTRQVQFYRYLINHATKWEYEPKNATLPSDYDLPWDPHTLRFKECVVVYLGPKGPVPFVVEKTVPHTTPNGRIIKRKKPYIWTDEEVLKELSPRLEMMLEALDAYPKWPAGLEKFEPWQGPASWKCPGPPLCRLNCLAKRWPDGLVWDRPV